MVDYPAPPAAGPLNGFLLTPTVALVVRHVRVTAVGEVVAEAANALGRQFAIAPVAPLASLVHAWKYHDRAPYVRARLEPGGVEVAGITLDDADFGAMRGYTDIWAVPEDIAVFAVAQPQAARQPVPAETVLRVPRIEPHQNPPWLAPPGRFEQ